MHSRCSRSFGKDDTAGVHSKEDILCAGAFVISMDTNHKLIRFSIWSCSNTAHSVENYGWPSRSGRVPSQKAGTTIPNQLWVLGHMKNRCDPNKDLQRHDSSVSAGHNIVNQVTDVGITAAVYLKTE